MRNNKGDGSKEEKIRNTRRNGLSEVSSFEKLGAEIITGKTETVIAAHHTETADFFGKTTLSMAEFTGAKF